MPISRTRCRVSASAERIVIGQPISLLCDATGATVGPDASRICARRSFVVVFPLDPVIAITVQDSRARTAAARRPRAACASSTMIVAPPVSRSARTATAPRARAWSAKSAPSTWAPGRAMKSDPAVACRESMTTVVITECGSASLSRPPTAAAASAIVIGIIAAPAGPRAAHLGHRRRWSCRRSPDPAHGPCRAR